MRERRLSERITRGTETGAVGLDPSVLLEDVLGHLRELFNVRQGSVPIRPDYGMPDINDVVHEFPDAIEILRTEIRHQLEKFEPRLSEVAVRHVPSPDRPLSLVFRITASLLVAGAGRVTMETEVGSDGLVRVAS